MPLLRNTNHLGTTVSLQVPKGSSTVVRESIAPETHCMFKLSLIVITENKRYVSTVQLELSGLR